MIYGVITVCVMQFFVVIVFIILGISLLRYWHIGNKQIIDFLQIFPPLIKLSNAFLKTINDVSSFLNGFFGDLDCTIAEVKRIFDRAVDLGKEGIDKIEGVGKEIIGFL